MRNYFALCIAGIIAMFIIAVTFESCKPKTGNNSQEQNDLPTFETDTVETAPLTVAEVLQRRDDMRLCEYEDSIWLTMPDEIIVQICVNKGTDLSQYEIVETYLQNKEFYDGFVKGSRYVKEHKESDIPITDSIK